VRPPRRILLIRPSALGDVCRSVPLAASLKAVWPESQLEWLVNAPYRDAVASHPAVDGIVAFDRARFVRSPAGAAAFLLGLRQRRYDLVIDAQGLARSGVFSWITRAPVRIAHRDAREGAWLAATRRVGSPPDRHTVDRMLDLLAPLGVPPVYDLRLTVPDAARRAIHRDPSLTPGGVVIAPTSLWPGKRWPIERFAELARRLVARGVEPIVSIGGPRERDQCGPLLAVEGVTDRVGRTSVAEMMAVIERSALVVANDSAALHIAVGLGRPIVALFGPTRTALVGPYGRDADVIQHVTPADRLDHKDHAAGRTLMERISVDEVEAAAVERLARDGSAVA
jgi:ADP-heptose:LPS heptosyltransferase